MKNLSDLLKIYYVILKFYGISIEKNEKSKKCCKIISKRFNKLFQVIEMYLAFIVVAQLIEAIRKHHTRKLQNEYYNASSNLTAIVIISGSIIRVYLSNYFDRFNYGKVLKSCAVADNNNFEENHLRQKIGRHFRFIAFAIVSNAILIVTKISIYTKDKQPPAFCYVFGGGYLLLLTFYSYLAAFSCSFFNTIIEYIILRLDLFSAQLLLPAPTSLYKDRKSTKKCVAEHKRLKDLADTFNDLFAHVLLFVCCSSLTVVPVLMSCLQNMNHVQFIITLLLNTPMLVNLTLVGHCIYNASRCNKKAQHLFKTMSKKCSDELNLSPCLFHSRLDQLFWIIDNQILFEDWFDMGKYVDFNVEILIMIAQTLFDYSNYFSKYPDNYNREIEDFEKNISIGSLIFG